MVNKTICVIGLGKVGYPLALVYASKGYSVFGVDNNSKRIKLLKENKLRFYETGVDELKKKSGNNLSLTSDYSKVLSKSDVFSIIVPTPSQKDGSFSLKNIKEALLQIALEVKKTDKFKIVVISSTLSPGSMEYSIQPYLEKISGKKAGKDFGLCYSPEFVALGSVISNLQNPDFILIGESDTKSGNILPDIRKSICNNKPPVHRTNFINAELSKLASNTFITTKISFINMITRICQKTKGADIDIISNILGDDSSIGHKRMAGSIAYGGPCYPRDNLALNSYANKIGTEAELAVCTHNFNLNQINYLRYLVLKNIKPGQKIGILGLSYKPKTDVIDESVGIKLIEALSQKKIIPFIYDPAALINTRNKFGMILNYCSTIKELISKSDLIVITTPWTQFKNLSDVNDKTIIDCWRMINPKKVKMGKYIPLGIGIVE